MPQQISTPEPDADRSRRSWYTTVRLGFAVAALGLMAALALVLMPGATGPSDSLAVADLSSADLGVDSAIGPDVTLANDYTDADRYVSANPFIALRNNDGGSANASLGFARLTPPRSTPRGMTTVCTPIIIGLPGGGILDAGMQVCTHTFTDSGTGAVLATVVMLRGYYEY
jgi:hypothetical protein